jgi:hypothetical protein
MSGLSANRKVVKLRTEVGLVAEQIRLKWIDLSPGDARIFSPGILFSKKGT